MKALLILYVLINIGIFAQSNWQQLDSPGGANVNTIFKVTDSIFLVGVQDGSFYRSTDLGGNWNKVFNGNHPSNLGNKAVRCFVFNSNQEILASTFLYGIRRSTDQGLTWIATNGAGGETMVNTDSGIMFGYDNVSSNWSFSKSLDSGKTWFYFPRPWGDNIYSMSVYGDEVFVGFRDSIIHSNNFGESWNKYGHSFSGSGINSILILGDSEVVSGTQNGVYYTSDAGNNWLLRNNGIPSTSNFIRNLQIVSDTIYAVGKQGLMYTTDKGLMWIPYNNNSFLIDVYKGAYTESIKLLATYSGVYKATPEGWEYSSQGIYSFTPQKIFRSSTGEIIYNTTAGLFKSSDEANSWNPIELENFFGGCKDIILNNNYLFVQTRGGKFYYSLDYGNNWIYTGYNIYGNRGMAFSSLTNSIFAAFAYYPIGYPPTDCLFITSNFGANWSVRYYNQTNFLTISPEGSIVGFIINGVSYENMGLQRSYNDGVSWTDMNAGLPNKSIKSLALDNNNDFYTSLDKGIFKCIKTGNSWIAFSDSTLENVSSINFDNMNQCIIIMGGQIYASVDGKYWAFCSEGLEDVSITKVFCDTSGYYYAADSKGKLYRTVIPHVINQLPSPPILVSPINNQFVIGDTVSFSWLQSSPLIINYSINISIDSSFTSYRDTLINDTSLTLVNLDENQYYYWRVKAQNVLGWSNFSNIGTFNTNVTDVEENYFSSFQFGISQNYPNPFNPDTKIKFTIPSVGTRDRVSVQLKVYDVLGKETATLVNEEKAAGNYEIEFNGNELPSGIYFYQIRAGNYSETKKMILMK